MWNCNKLFNPANKHGTISTAIWQQIIRGFRAGRLAKSGVPHTHITYTYACVLRIRFYKYLIVRGFAPRPGQTRPGQCTLLAWRVNVNGNELRAG